MKNRDVEKSYSTKDLVQKLRRLAESIESGDNFRILIAGEEIYVPDRAQFNSEHERSDGENEIEFQIRRKGDK